MKFVPLLLAAASASLAQGTPFDWLEQKSQAPLIRLAELRSGFLGLGQAAPTSGQVRCGNENEGSYILKNADPQQIDFMIRTPSLNGQFILQRDGDRDSFHFSGYWATRGNFTIDSKAQIVYDPNKDMGTIAWGAGKDPIVWQYQDGKDPNRGMVIQLFGGKRCIFTPDSSSDL